MSDRGMSKLFCFASRRRQTRCALVTGVQRVLFRSRRRTAGEKAHAHKTAWVFMETSWRNKTLFSVSQAGLINNLNDGMSWGVFPLLFASVGVGLEGIGWIKAVYPVVWGAGQIVTGPLADRIGRKPLIVRSEEQTSELQSLMSISYAVFCLKQK